MGNQKCLQRVPQSGLQIGKKNIPLAFFRHGQPGRKFVVCPAEQDWRIHVRKKDIKMILTAYEEWLIKRSSSSSRTRRSGPPEYSKIPSSLFADDRILRNPDGSGRGGVRLATDRDLARLLQAERRELEEANKLAVQLVAMKNTLMSAGGLAFSNPCVQRLQERHARHLERCLRLRALLCDLVGGQSRGMQLA
mgnify:CR=1 FL=1